jgi:hypothetical protein
MANFQERHGPELTALDHVFLDGALGVSRQ